MTKEKYLTFTVDEKLHWAFKLYDKDGSGEIDPEEMEEIFTKLCSLVTVERRMEDREREKFRPSELLDSSVLKPFLVTLGLMVLVQLSGHGSLTFYAAHIFEVGDFRTFRF